MVDLAFLVLRSFHIQLEPPLFALLSLLLLLLLLLLLSYSTINKS